MNSKVVLYSVRVDPTTMCRYWVRALRVADLAALQVVVYQSLISLPCELMFESLAALAALQVFQYLLQPCVHCLSDHVAFIDNRLPR
jgi:hypothetical protein